MARESGLFLTGASVLPLWQPWLEHTWVPCDIMEQQDTAVHRLTETTSHLPLRQPQLQLCS